MPPEEERKNFEKEEHPLQNCQSFEEFISGIIKDKPSNIEIFFQVYQKEAEKDMVSLIDFFLMMMKLSDEHGMKSISEGLRVGVFQVEILSR